MPEESAVRLQKFLAANGLGSRRQAETCISEGRVTVNGKVAELGQRIDPERDRVVFDGRRIRQPQTARKLVLMMNKPKGVLCTNHDPHHHLTVFSILPKELQGTRLFCAGRLDKDSEGLVILTNDGDLAHRITHPAGGVVKRYHVTLNRDFTPEKIPAMLKGVTREGELLYAKKIIPASKGPDFRKRVEIHLEQGRKREIRRLMEAFGFFVKKLKRYQMGKLVLKGMAPGAIRVLKPSEIECLFHSS